MIARLSGYSTGSPEQNTFRRKHYIRKYLSHTQHSREMRKVLRVCSFLILMLLSTLAESRRGPGGSQGDGASRSEKVVISSTGGAAQHQGGLLGQFEYLEDKDYYLQSSTEQNNEQFIAVYLYPDEDDEWWVGSTPGQKRGWFYNSSPSKTPPNIGWMFDDGWSWYNDTSITITPGPLPPLPRQFTVTALGAAAEEWPSFLGLFTRTQRWWLGRPVYVNTQGRLLHHGHQDKGWVIGPSIASIALRGSRAHHNPASEDSWRYWTGSGYEPASVTVSD